MAARATTVAGYDAQRGRYAFLRDSYWGGNQYRNPSSTTMGSARLTQWVQTQSEVSTSYELRTTGTIRSYLVPHAGESAEKFRVRCELAAHFNVSQPICDAYVDAVTGPVTRELGSLDPYLKNLNGRGMAWPQHVDEVARWAAVYGWVAAVYDNPPTNPAASLAEEEALGIGLRATIVHPTAIAWIAVDRDGAVEEIAFVDKPYAPDDSAPARMEVSVYVYDRATWRVHSVTVSSSVVWSKIRPKLSEKNEVARGPSPTPGRVPVAFAFFREMSESAAPQGMSLIDDAADLSRQVYNHLSWIEEIHRKTAFPFLGIPERASGGALDPETRVQVGPENAFGYNAESGSPAWVTPPDSTTPLRIHALFLVAAALRTTGLEVTATDSGADASGEALKVRSRDFNARCTRFARSMHAFETNALRLASIILKASATPVLTYPKRFVLPDSAQDLASSLLAFNALWPELGPEARLKLVRAVFDSALSLSDDELTQVVVETRAKLSTPAPTTQPKPAAGAPSLAPGGDA